VEVAFDLPVHRLIYVGSPKDEKYDQVLDQFSMGPLQQGVMQFAMETAPPNVQLIPSKEDLIGVTAIILSVSFMKKEFFRVQLTCHYEVWLLRVQQLLCA
jgi:histone chaperone ASF1